MDWFDFLAVLSGLVLISWFLKAALPRRIRSQGSRQSCAVSRAQLTCDAGDSTAGYNSVVAVVKFAGPVSAPSFIRQFRSCVVEREKLFRMCMAFHGGNMEWYPANSSWTPSDNFEVISKMNDSALSDLAATALASPIELAAPCWRIFFIEKVVNTGAEDFTSAVVFKYHHSMADGFTMIQKMATLIRPIDASRPLTELFPPSHKPEKPRGLISSAAAAWQFLKSTIEILGMSPDAPGSFRSELDRRPGEPLVVSFSGNIKLEQIKKIASRGSEKPRSGRISINDVITAVISRAFRSFHIKKGEGDPNEDLTSVVWVSLNKNMEKPQNWNNSNLGFAYVKLPLTCEKVDDCLSESHHRLVALKSSAGALVINTALRILGSLPLSIGKKVAKATADIASVSMSNLIGPNAPVYWPASGSDIEGAGLVDSIYFATSPPFRFGPLVSVISYCGTLYFSISAREGLLSKDDLDWITQVGISNAVDELASSL
jgi:hypothetical protein